jgi:hypothetical protein
MRLARHLLFFALGFAAAATPALGQGRAEQDDAALLEQQQEQQQQAQQQQRAADQPGKVAESSVGRAGQRQTREDVAPSLRPTERISSRIENRVQSRINNRIDQDDDPEANAKSPFATAEERERAAGR